MAMLAEFELLMPATLSEALAALADHVPHGRPVAGGTNLVPDLRSGRHQPPVLVNINGLPELKGICEADGTIWVGAGTTIATLLKDPRVPQSGAVLKQAAAVFASPLVRNRATLGGNLADGSPAADTAPALLALDAEVELASQAGVRTLPLNEFFLGVRRTACRPDELIRAVRWPASLPGSGSAYTKLGLRKADAIAVVSVAVRLAFDPQGGCCQARIALGSVAPIPFRAATAEALLLGQAITPALAAEAGWLAAEAAAPISDVRASASYRKRMVAVLVRRLLLQAAGYPEEGQQHGI
jgi:carbon-monoxide dehydrogenase medium subunit